MHNSSGDNIIEFFEKRLSSNKKEYARIFEEVQSKFSPKSVANLLNYLLENSNEPKILDITLRLVNKYKYVDNFQSLYNFVANCTQVNYTELKVIAIKSLGAYKNKKALGVLLECLNDKNSNYKVRLAAADALGKIGDKSAFEPLSAIISDDNEKSSYVKETAVVALGMLGDSRALDVFGSIINAGKLFKEKFSFLKERIIEALARLDISEEGKAIEILKTGLMEPSSHLRIASIEALMNINNSQCYDLIYDRLKFDEDTEVRKNALVALYNITDKAVLDEVIQGDFPLELKDFAKNIMNEYEDSNE